MKLLSQQPWDTVVDFLVRYPNSPEEAKALGRIVNLLRDAIHEKRWRANRFLIRDLLLLNDWAYMWGPTPEGILRKLNDMVYGENFDEN